MDNREHELAELATIMAEFELGIGGNHTEKEMLDLLLKVDPSLYELDVLDEAITAIIAERLGG